MHGPTNVKKYRQCSYESNSEARSFNHCCCGRARMCTCVACEADAPYCLSVCGLFGCPTFFQCYINVTIFGEIGTERKCVYFLYNFCLKHFLTGIRQDSIDALRFHVKYFCGILKLNFLNRFSKKKTLR